MSREFIERCRNRALELEDISESDALELLSLPSEFTMDLLAAADAVRRRHKGTAISLCSVVNARSGRCEEDCAFCAQSAFSKADSPEYPLMETVSLLEAAQEAVVNGAHKFGVVTSGKGPGKVNGDFDSILNSIKSIRDSVEVHRCASLGVVTREEAVALKEAGLQEFHHNLETARSFYSSVCTTRPYDENVEAVKSAKSAGLRVCCGGIFGMGESAKQRVELAAELRSLEVDSVPLNFLNPIKGTRLENETPLRPLEILRIIAVYRLFLPGTDIKVAGGREVNLRDLQSFIFFAGANSTMVGNYLTTRGRNSDDDLRMVADLELEVVKYH